MILFLGAETDMKQYLGEILTLLFNILHDILNFV